MGAAAGIGRVSCTDVRVGRARGSGPDRQSCSATGRTFSAAPTLLTDQLFHRRPGLPLVAGGGEAPPTPLRSGNTHARTHAISSLLDLSDK